jgi:hypothetical protein
MAGKYSGVATRIQRIYEKAVYVHCNSHVLNLCIASACQMPIIRGMMDDIRSVSNFFNDSPKRTLILKAKINEVIPTAKRQKLLNVCRTRWIARIDGLRIFRNCYAAILAALEVINNDRSNEPDVRLRAGGMRKAVKKFEFIVCLVLVERCLKCTKPLTLQLQSASLDAGKAREKVSLLYLTIDELRADIDQTHDTFYQMAVDLAKEVKIDPNKKRTTGRQVHRENVPADTTSDYYKRAVTIPFLDQLLGQVQSRFSEGNLDILDMMYGMPNLVVSDSDWEENFLRFLMKYEDDLPDIDFLECELRMWRLKFSNQEPPLPSSFDQLLSKTDALSFPNILTAMRIFGTIPVTSCSCERSISTLRRLKTFMRSTMGEKRLTSLALLNVHREIKLDLDKVIDRFALKHPRMLLVDLLNSDDTVND